jgi:hypothetical protein
MFSSRFYAISSPIVSNGITSNFSSTVMLKYIHSSHFLKYLLLLLIYVILNSCLTQTTAQVILNIFNKQSV